MQTKFSDRLLSTSRNTKDKSLKGLINAFADKSFAIVFLILMAIPALPAPTGGITHIFEIIVMLLSVELIAGRTKIWLPKRWLAVKLPDKFWSGTLPAAVKLIRKLERLSRPRLGKLVLSSWFNRIIGSLVLIFSLFAFLAPPFSGLDTLPSLGVVLLSLGMIFEDLLLIIIASVVGFVGIGLVFILGSVVLQLL